MKALRRIVAACLCVVPALAMADATRGGVEASSLTVVRTNSFGLAEDLRLGYRVPLGEPESTFLLPYGQAAVSPANVQTGIDAGRCRNSSSHALPTRRVPAARCDGHRGKAVPGRTVAMPRFDLDRALASWIPPAVACGVGSAGGM